MTDEQKADFCDNYCRYSWTVHTQDLLTEICDHCPLNDTEDEDGQAHTG